MAQLAGIAQAELRTARECFDGTTGLPKRAVPVFLAAVSPPIPLRAPFSLFVCVLTLPRGRWKRPPSDPGEVVPGPARLAQSRLQPVRRDAREAVLEAAVPGVGRCEEQSVLITIESSSAQLKNALPRCKKTHSSKAVASGLEARDKHESMNSLQCITCARI